MNCFAPWSIMKSSRGGCDARIVARLKERVNRLATASRAIPVIGFGSKQGALTGTPRRRLLALFFYFQYASFISCRRQQKRQLKRFCGLSLAFASVALLRWSFFVAPTDITEITCRDEQASIASRLPHSLTRSLALTAPGPKDSLRCRWPSCPSIIVQMPVFLHDQGLNC